MQTLTFCLLPCTGKYSVPVLWDKKRSTIVNNESSEIIRMFNTVRRGERLPLGVQGAGGGLGCFRLPWSLPEQR